MTRTPPPAPSRPTPPPAAPPGQPAAAPPPEENPYQYKPKRSLVGLYVAGGVVLIFVIVLIALLVGGGFPEPEKVTAEMCKIRTVKMSLATFMTSPPFEEGDAADDYKRAIDLMNEDIYETGKYFGEPAEGTSVSETYGGGSGGRRVRRRRSESNTRPRIPAAVIKNLQGVVDHVKKGTAKKSMTFTFVHTPQQLRVSPYYDAIDDLHKLSSVLDTMAAWHLINGNEAEAIKTLEAEFILGWHMYNEHRHLDVMQRGIAVQDQAIEGLQNVYRADEAANADKLEAVQRYGMELTKLRAWFDTKLRIVWRLSPLAGDVRFVVENDEDTAWRVQALLAMGMLRFNGSSRSIREGAHETLQSYANDPNIMLSTAARSGLSLTRDQLSQLGAGN